MKNSENHVSDRIFKELSILGDYQLVMISRIRDDWKNR